MSIELKDNAVPIDGAGYTSVGKKVQLGQVDNEGSDDGSKKGEEEEAPFFSVAFLWAAVVKQGDQMSPLLLKKMPAVIILLVLLILAGSYLGAFFYQIEQMFALCTEENNCISCALTIEDVPGATCDRLAATNLNVAAGCTSIPVGNNYINIRSVLDGINATIESKKANFNDDFYNSLVKHGGIADTLQGNALNQMIDPDQSKMRSFLDSNYFGLSDTLIRTTGLHDDVITAAGLKILYSYISIGCAIASAESFGTLQYGGHDYTQINICGCRLFCPALNNVSITGQIDISIDSAGVASNGLAELSLYLPDHYVQVVDVPDFDPSAGPPVGSLEEAGASFVDELAVVEMQYKDFTTDVVRHCPSSVFTQTPAQLNGVLYQCCTEKSVIEKLSEISAFSSLVLTFAVIATTVMFYPFGPRGKEVEDEFKEMVQGVME